MRILILIFSPFLQNISEELWLVRTLHAGLFQGDVKLMAETGLEAYRFSISWSRFIPNGRGAVIQEGLKYYNNVIDELAKRGILPHIMLYHLDLPQALEDEYDGWLSTRIALQKGIVGVNMLSLWSYPLTNSIADLQADQRYRDFSLPTSDEEKCRFSSSILNKVQTELVKGAVDFIGINHYYFLYVNDRPLVEGVRDYVADRSVSYRVSKTDPPTEQHDPAQYPNDPKGLQLALEYLREYYGDFPIYIQENGKGSRNDSLLDDTDRVDYIKGYIGGVLDAIRNGVNVRGYFVWSFVDVLDLLDGYQTRYGLYRVDFDDGALPRRARRSTRWYSDFVRSKQDPVLIAQQ
uniref:4-hydroxy-7-methoxy-3-oxo-3,4-dihydro-2H-1,4-benzoxazin-2-yl glucosidebeta-D-glucosidase n=1 Tax=Oryza punctata TaxID=4537 RepID=A0A0E0JQ59_ORYPU